MFKKGNKGLLLTDSLRFIIGIIPHKMRMRAAKNLLFVFINSLIELIGIAFLIPLLVVVLDENKVQTNVWLNKIYVLGGFTSNKTFVIFLCVLILFFIVLKNIISFLLVRLQFKFSFSIYTFVSKQLFNYYYSQGLLEIKEVSSNRIVNHLSSVTLLFVQNVINAVLGIISEALVVILFIVALILYDPWIILLMAVLILPSIMIFFRIVKNKLHEQGKERNRIVIEQNKNLFETFQGYPDIEIRNKDGWAFKRFAQTLDEMNRVQVKNALFLQLPLKVIEVTIVAALIILISFGMLFGKSLGEIGVLVGIFAVAAYRMLPGTNRLMNFFMVLRNHIYTFDIIGKIAPLRNVSPDLYSETAEKVEELSFKHKILLKDISFSFDKRNMVLQNVNLQINKGDILGIIGRSGSGKSTLLNIILRFYKESDGTVWVDNEKISDKNLAAWRNLVGYVPQEVYVFDTSLAENIALGEDKASIDYERLSYVLKRVHLFELVNSWENGIETILNERGGRLSGGQKQRLGIARALYSGAQVLFFDEATSSLDIKTEEEITTAIRELSAADNQLTIVIIAHRYATLKNCNRIIELKEGHITEELTFQLLKERIGEAGN